MGVAFIISLVLLHLLIANLRYVCRTWQLLALFPLPVAMKTADAGTIVSTGVV